MPTKTRDNQGRWKKGESGNPKGGPGRPKRFPELREQCQRICLANMPVLIDIIVNGDRDSDRIAAFKLCAEYGFGKPSQQIEVKQVNPLDHENRWVLEVAEKPKDAESSTNGKSNGHG